MTRAILTLCHGDEVSGLSLMDDGTKVYWTEGRGSFTTILFPDGRIGEISASDSALPQVIHDLPGDAPMRAMTREEELEYDLTINRTNSAVVEITEEFLKSLKA